MSTTQSNGLASLKKMPPKELAQYLDHTVLRPEATESEILKACDEALQYSFKGVCIESRWLPTVVPKLKGSRVLAVTVVSFPHGSGSTEEKVAETKLAVERGAQEVDMVLNRELLKTKKLQAFYEDIRKVVLAAGQVPVKVILETSELTRDEKVIACAVCTAAGASYVKTSTGFSKSGATVEDVELMRSVVGSLLGVKASGGVRSYESALQMIAAGATRIGTSSSVAIVNGASQNSSY